MTFTPVPIPTIISTPFAPGRCPQRLGPAATLTPEELETPPSNLETQEQHLLEYLNTVGSADGLEVSLNRLTYADGGKVRAQVRITDLTGDGFVDVVVSVISYYEEHGRSATPSVFVFGCNDDEFRTIFADFYGGEVPEYSELDGLRSVRDLNRNGIPEILLSIIVVRGTHGYFHRMFRILEWDGSTFRDLIPAEFAGLTLAMSENADHAIIDTDGDGSFELILTQGLAPYYGGPQRVRTDTWAWDGLQYRLKRWEHTPAIFRFQAVQDGDDASRFGEFDRALKFYQQAIFDEKLLGWAPGYFYDLLNPTPPPGNPEERPQLEAYSRFRILLLHAISGNLDAAEITYSTLQQKFPPGSLGSSYAGVARAFWETFLLGGDITQSCASAITYAYDHDAKVLGPLAPGNYEYEAFFYKPEDVCPFTDG